MSDRRTLHPHQFHALDLMRQSWRKQRAAGQPIRTVVQAPTAFGKTVVMATTARSFLLNGVPSIGILVPRLQLIDQTIAQLEAEGIRYHEIGVIQGNHKRVKPMASIQICTPQTLAHRSIAPFGAVMVDECHEQHKFTRELMQHPDWQNVPFFGWSATPWSKGLGTYWNDLVIPASTQELIEAINPATGKPYLSPFRVFAPPSGIRPDLTNIPTAQQAHGRDYVVGDLSVEMRREPLIADAVTTWKALARGRPTLAFCVDRAHADKVHQHYCVEGVFAEYLDGNTPMKDRVAIRERMRTGQTEVVVNISVLTTGNDWPEVSCIQLLRPTKSEMLHVQTVGRGLRPSEGKDDCLVLDHSSTTERLGFVTDIHHTELDDGKPKVTSSRAPKDEPKAKECTKCHRMRPPKTPVCPSCGHEHKVQSKVETLAGELKEVKDRKKAPPTIAEKQVWWSSLLHIADKHVKDGKKTAEKARKWALAIYHNKFGVWPRGLQDVTAEPAPGVVMYVKGRQIAWAKGRGREQGSAVA